MGFFFFFFFFCRTSTNFHKTLRHYYNTTTNSSDDGTTLFTFRGCPANQAATEGLLPLKPMFTLSFHNHLLTLNTCKGEAVMAEPRRPQQQGAAIGGGGVLVAAMLAAAGKLHRSSRAATVLAAVGRPWLRFKASQKQKARQWCRPRTSGSGGVSAVGKLP